MSTIINLLKLLYPFLQEFGFKEINLRTFIRENKSLSYMFLMCVIMFIAFTYALEQAHLRMVYRTEFISEKIILQQQLESCKILLDDIESYCDGNDISSESLEKILGLENGE